MLIAKVDSKVICLFISMILTLIPNIEASVPATVLTHMFGQATSGVLKRLNLAVNG